MTTPTPIGWSPARTHTGGCHHRPGVWRDCPRCWAQGRMWTRRPYGWVHVPCPVCLGVGQIHQTAA